MDSPAKVRRHFLPWHRPLLEQAVGWLAGDWTGQGPLDLTGWGVVVPTRQAGRRLREALAVHAAQYGQAVFPPRVMTPDRLVQPLETVPVASVVLARLAWVEVLEQADLTEFRAVFPVDPPVQNFSWALRVAQTFGDLQMQLAEGGWLIREVAKRGGDFPETARWVQLGELERRQEQKLRQLGRVDAAAARLAAARPPGWPEGWQRLALLAVPDPSPLVVRALGHLAKQQSVDVVVYAPPHEAENFDEWGRPKTLVWAKREWAVDDFPSQVHLMADPSAQADLVARLARDYGEPEGRLAVGVADAEVGPELAAALRRAGLEAYNPEGKSWLQEGLYPLLEALAGLVKDDGFEAVERLARFPEIGDLLARRIGGAFVWTEWLSGLDDLRARHLPATLEKAAGLAAGSSRLARHGAGLAVIGELRARLVGGGFAAALAEVLSEIFDGGNGPGADPQRARFAAAAEAWMEILRECAEAESNFPELDRAAWWELALQRYGEGRWAMEKTAGAVELLGWLELLWEDAPQLVVAGMNDGCVPQRVAGDAYLPETLRAGLGLKTDAERLGRDAYWLQALTASRREGGRIDLLYGKESARGEPLRPSRLLLACPEEELPARVDLLFRAAPSAGNWPEWQRAWRLRIRHVTPPTEVRVTALKAWLTCPFRFHLRHNLKMQPVDPTKSEMDAFEFGTLCHGALEQLGHDPGLGACTDAAVLRDFFSTWLDRQAAKKYGPELSLPLLVQLESARQRLAKVAEVQAKERAAGWEIVAVERSFSLAAGGLKVNGKIDRIERHRESGAVRVLDYKTSDTPVTPEDAHLRAPKSGETAPTWREVSLGGKPKVWVDLQLPLYWWALRQEFGEGVQCGYFNLPRATGGTRLELWPDYSPELQNAAWRCAEGVCAAIKAGEFWPPVELRGAEAKSDDFAPLFHRGAAASLIWPEGPG